MVIERKNKAKLSPLACNRCPWTWRMSNIWIVFLLLATLSLTACGRTVEWKQEVPLHDGRVIVIDRMSQQGPHDPFVNMRMEIGQELAFTHPDTSERVRWKIPDGLQPYMLDFDGLIPYYVLAAYTVGDYNKWGCPNPPYFVYRYERGQWGRIAFEQLPAKFQKRNLIAMAKAEEKFVGDGYVTAAELETYVGRKDPPRRVISREKVNPIAKGCFESTLIKQGRQSEIDNRR